jgi:ferric-dicitrate binding protein FerR (iron transport regulator)
VTIAILIVAALLQAPAARITAVHGGIELGDTAVAARAGEWILAGDRVHTLKDSSLTLATESGLVVQLRPDTRLEMKNLTGEPIVLLTDGSVNVKSEGKPVRVETRYGQIIGTENSQEFDVTYSGDAVQVLMIRGSLRAELSDPLKVTFKSASGTGPRVYEAGSISPPAPRAPRETTVIVYPTVESPIPRFERTGTPPIPVTPSIPSK